MFFRWKCALETVVYDVYVPMGFTMIFYSTCLICIRMQSNIDYICTMNLIFYSIFQHCLFCKPVKWMTSILLTLLAKNCYACKYRFFKIDYNWHFSRCFKTSKCKSDCRLFLFNYSASVVLAC